MQPKITLEIWLCLGLICLGVFALLTIELAEDSASPFLLRQERSMGTLDYTTLPNISALALIVLSAANIGLIKFKHRKTKPSAAADSTPTQHKLVRWRTVGTAIFLLAYTLALPHVPFFFSTALFLATLFWLYGLQQWKKNIAIACIGSGFFWLIFVYISSLAL